jgi:hypothetical protein
MPSFQICLRKGVGEHVLLFVGSLKGLAIPKVGAKMLSCKLLSTTAELPLFFTFGDVNQQC